MESLIQKENIHLTNILNPFDPHGSREFKEMPRGLSLKECIDLVRDPLTNCYDISVAVNGELVPADTDYSLIYPQGNVVICVIPQGGGGNKNVLRLVLQLAVVVIAAAATWYIGGSGGYLVGSGFALNTANAIAIGAGMAISVVGNTLISALIPYDMTDSNDADTSPTYSWDVKDNSNREGVVWPVLYGTTRIIPPIIGKYIEIVNNKQYLNILYAIADHPIDSIDETSILLNDNTVFKDSNNVTWEYRLGALDQIPISYFTDTRSTKSVNMKCMDGSWLLIDADGTQTEALGIAISFPLGMNITNDDGNYENSAWRADIEYKEINAAEWTPLVWRNSTEITIGTARWSAGFWLGGKWYEYEAGSTNQSDHVEGDAYSPLIWLYHPIYQDRKVNQWRWCTAGTKIQDVDVENEGGLTYWPPWISKWWKEKYILNKDYYEYIACTTKPQRRIIYADNLPPGQYQVRMRYHNGVAQDPTPRECRDGYFDYLESIIYDQFSFPGASVFGLRALATDKLSGSMPTLSLIATRSTVPVWTGEAYENKPANNPAWASYDTLHDSFYGGGVPYSRIVYEDFLAWASNNDLHYISDGVPSTVKFECNIYLDASTSLRKTLNTLGQLGRGNTIQMGSKFTCFVDKLETLPAQSFIFNMANIKAKSFNIEYMDVENRANAIDVTFWDKDNKYKQRTIELHASDFDSATQEVKKTQLTLKGCVTLEEAIAHGNFALNCNRFLVRTANWESDIDAIGCMPWDVVEVQHDVMLWGEGGLAVSATVSQLTLDKEITLLPDVVYTLRIQSADDDTTAEYTLKNVDFETTTSTITITGAFNPLPVEYDKWNISAIGCATKFFRLLKTSRLSDLTRKLTCLEYNASIYDDTKPLSEAEAAPTITYEAHLRAQEVQLWNGNPDTFVNLSWTGFALLWHVFYKSYYDIEYTYAGSTNNPFFRIEKLPPRDDAYTFCISHTRNTDDGITTTLIVAGNSIIAVPETPLNLTATLIDGVIKLAWDAPTDVTIIGYSVYLNSSLIATNVSGTSFTYSETLTAGTYNFTLAALTAGGESDPTETAGITISVPSTPVPSATIVGEQSIVAWSNCKTSLPISYYKVNTINVGNALRYIDRVNWTGEKVYSVIAVDIAGNESAAGTTSLTTTAQTTPTGIVTSGLTYAIRLALTYATFDGFNVVEVWASSTNNRANATKVGETATTVFTHNGLSLIDSRYYWIRTRDIYGTAGSWYPSSATAGVSGSTSTDPDDYLTILYGYDNLNTIAGVDFLVAGKVNGMDTVGITGDLIIDGSILARNIGANEVIANSANIKDAIITNAKIASLDVSKLTTGTVTSKKITLAVTDGQGDVYIASGKTDFNNTDSGFILGVDDSDSNKAKFYIGNSTNYLNWDGGTLTIRGALNATDITTGTLSVDRISSGSISVPVAAFTSGSTKLSSGTITLQSAEITTIGSVVFIIFSCIGNSDGSITKPATHDIKFYRDSTLIKEYKDMAWIYSDHYHTHTFSFSDTPAAGTYIYYAQATYVSGSAGNFSNRSLFLLELRK